MWLSMVVVLLLYTSYAATEDDPLVVKFASNYTHFVKYQKLIKIQECLCRNQSYYCRVHDGEDTFDIYTRNLYNNPHVEQVYSNIYYCMVMSDEFLYLICIRKPAIVACNDTACGEICFTSDTSCVLGEVNVMLGSKYNFSLQVNQNTIVSAGVCGKKADIPVVQHKSAVGTFSSLAALVLCLICYFASV